jgi:Lrp/AsnC family transcriptional regulator for asnA, asnC and gidA
MLPLHDEITKGQSGRAAFVVTKAAPSDENHRGRGTRTGMLEALDRQIICILQGDGRASNVEVARQMGVSEATVRKRLDRLLADGVIRVTAVPDAGKAGFATTTFMTFRVDLGRVNQIAEQIAGLPEVRAIHLTAGESDLIVEAWFTCREDLLRFMTQHVGPISGIRRVATAHVLRTINDGSTWTLPAIAGGAAPSP